MTSRERFITALSGGTPDRVPIFEHLFSRKLMQELLGETTELYDGGKQMELATKLGIDCLWTPINGFCGLEETPHQTDEVYKDEWGGDLSEKRLAYYGTNRHADQKPRRLGKLCNAPG